MSKRTLDAFLGKPAPPPRNGRWQWSSGPGWAAGSLPKEHKKETEEPGSPVVVSSFDLDGTLIAVKSGKRFPIDKNDWKLLCPEVSATLAALPPTCILVLFSNQAGVGSGKTTLSDMQEKVERVFGAINPLHLDVRVYLSTGKGKYRKPGTGMWELFQRDIGSRPIDMKTSYFVGDAAGRAASPRHIKDHASSDWKFALNVGLKFLTPEEYFLKLENEAVRGLPRGFNPRKFLDENEAEAVPALEQILDPPDQSSTLVDKSLQQVILMVGWPGSGKTTFAKTFLEPAGYHWVNQDTLKSKARCLASMETALKEGRSVVIDNTNPKREARAAYIGAAKRAKVPCRCLVLQSSRELAEHLNVYRQTHTHGRVQKIPAIGYHTYNKNFEVPTKDEGLEGVLKLNPRLHFENPEDRKLFLQWT